MNMVSESQQLLAILAPKLKGYTIFTVLYKQSCASLMKMKTLYKASFLTLPSPVGSWQLETVLRVLTFKRQTT